MTLILWKGSVQARIEGFEHLEWGDDDYDVVDDTVVVGRIYRQRLLGEFKAPAKRRARGYMAIAMMYVPGGRMIEYRKA